MNTTRTTSFMLPEPLEKQMLQTVVQEGYGLRGKSKWLIDAITDFLSLKDYPELVDIADEMQNLTKVVSVRLPMSLAKSIEEAVIHVRQKYPALDSVKSNIIRASIMQRLLRANSGHRNFS